MDRSLISIPSEFIVTHLNYFILTACVWITYCYTLKCGFVSDDFQGILEYDGRLQTNLGKDKDKDFPLWKRLRYTSYGMFLRWIRFHICGGDFPSAQKYPTGNPIPQGKLPIRHHLLSVLIFNLAVLSTFHFLSSVLGVKVALLAMILLIVHPVATQAIAWCSGIGYPLSLLWVSLSFNLVQWYGHEPHSYWVMGLTFLAFAILNFLAINALFIGLMAWTILLFLNQPIFAAINILVSIVVGLGVVKETISYRQTEFKKQNMGHSVFVKWRKGIVALKTILYYFKLIIWPSKMGLYHEWGYHYGPDLEREDKMMLGGLLCVLGSIAVFFLTPYVAVKLGILWFYSFIFIFLNWITIQQFVTERYAFVPTLGFGIIVAFLLQDYLPIYMLVIGLYIARTWCHLPTYDNELRFYESNVWNFPKSEVAFGNLGVTYLRVGAIGSSTDTWNRAIQINTDYDVPYYNIYSHYKSNGSMAIQQGLYDKGIDLYRMALPFIEKCVSCKVSHFKADWTKEYNDLKLALENPALILSEELKRLKELDTNLKTMRSKASVKKQLDDVDLSINNNTSQIENLLQFIKARNIPLTDGNTISQINQDSLLNKLYKGA